MTPPHSRDSLSPQIVLLSILGFWLFHAAIVTVRAAVMDFPAQGEMAWRRVVVTLAGIVITWLLFLALRPFARALLPVRVAAAFVLAVPAAAAIAFVNYYAFSIYDPISLFADGAAGDPIISPAQEIAEVAVSRYFFMIAWASLYLALSYARDVRNAERTVARFALAAQQAELRSLRYQVNPHFLFNTLNSLSSLVLSGRAEAAETMIMNLADFYRTSLTGDPLEDVTVAEEVELQRRYLAIEAVRFPDRLSVAIDIPDTVAGARVPGMILQPLVENALKHGVAQATALVTLRIAARQDDDGRIVLSVHDDGAGCGPAADGGAGGASEGGSGGIGLANVRDRLEARFGSRASLVTGPAPGGGFAAHIHVPRVMHDA